MQKIRVLLTSTTLLLIYCIPCRASSTDVEPIEVIAAENHVSAPRWHHSRWSTQPHAYAGLERGINLVSAHCVRPRTFLIVIDHRANQPFTNNSFRDFIGFDAGSLKLGLGVRYGILQNLDVGLYRLNGTKEIFDAYQLDARVHLLQQKRFHFDLALLAGLTWFYQPAMQDALGGYGQLIVQRLIVQRILVATHLMFHSESSYAEKTAADTNWSLALGALVELRLLDFLALDGEIVGSIAGYKARYPGWSVALKFITTRHTFSLIISNTQYINADGIVVGSNRGFDALIAGFAIVREISF